MAIQRTQSKSDLERKLKLLEYQLYGQQEKLDVGDKKMGKVVRSLSLENPTSISDVAYLKQDLKKIFILASLAVTTELLLYFSSLNKLVKLF